MDETQISELVNVINGDRGEAWENTFVALNNLSVSDYYNVKMAEPQLGLLQLLVSSTVSAVSAKVSCFKFCACSANSKSYMGENLVEPTMFEKTQTLLEKTQI